MRLKSYSPPENCQFKSHPEYRLRGEPSSRGNSDLPSVTLAGPSARCSEEVGAPPGFSQGPERRCRGDAVRAAPSGERALVEDDILSKKGQGSLGIHRAARPSVWRAARKIPALLITRRLPAPLRCGVPPVAPRRRRRLLELPRRYIFPASRSCSFPPGTGPRTGSGSPREGLDESPAKPARPTPSAD